MPDYPEYAQDMDFSVPEGVKEEIRQGLDAFEEGHGGDGLEDVTVKEARALVRGEMPTVFKVEKGYGFTQRNQRFADLEVNSPGWVAWKLWGGEAGMAWFKSLWGQLEGRRKDLSEPERRTFRIFSWGSVEHKNGDFVVDRAFGEALVEAFEFYAERSYFPPIWREHQAEGFTYGRVVSIFLDEDGINVTVEFPRLVAQWFDDGFLDSWSPSFLEDFKDPHTNRVFPVVLRELSFVGVRHLKNLPGASPYYSTKEAVKSLAEHLPTENKMEEMLEKVLEELAKLANAQTDLREEYRALSASVTALMESEEEVEMEEEEAEEGPSELAEAKAELAEVKRELAETQIRAELPGVTDEEVTALCEATTEGRVILMKALKAKTPTDLGETGTTGNTSVNTTPDADDFVGKVVSLCESYKEEGLTARRDVIIRLEQEGVSTLDGRTFTGLNKVFPK